MIEQFKEQRQEKGSNQEKLINDLIDYINETFRIKSKDADEEFGKPIRDKYIKAINSGDVELLEKLFIKIEATIAYESKYRETKEDLEQHEKLETISRGLEQWIELLKKK